MNIIKTVTALMLIVYSNLVFSEVNSNVIDQRTTQSYSEYTKILEQAIERQNESLKPELAKDWKGNTVLELQIDNNGSLTSTTVSTSSGSSKLDLYALDRVEKAKPFPAPPIALQGRNISIMVVVSFKFKEAPQHIQGLNEQGNHLLLDQTAKHNGYSINHSAQRAKHIPGAASVNGAYGSTVGF